MSDYRYNNTTGQFDAISKRRGACAVYVPSYHLDVNEFLALRQEAAVDKARAPVKQLDSCFLTSVPEIDIDDLLKRSNQINPNPAWEHAVDMFSIRRRSFDTEGRAAVNFCVRPSVSTTSEEMALKGKPVSPTSDLQENAVTM